MGRGTAAFVFKLVSNLTGHDLKEVIKTKILDHVYKPVENQETGRGFININVETPELSTLKIPEVYYFERDNKLISLYREYTSKYDKYDKKNRIEINDIYTLYDIQKRLLILRTSNASEVNKLCKIFDKCADGTHLRSPIYIDDEIFFRWVITNAKNGRENLPVSCKLQNIAGAYIKDFQDYDKYATTESIKIQSTEDLSEDGFYEPIKDKGDRTYINGIFLHERWSYGITIYKNGKVTLGKRPDGVEDIVFYSMFGVAFEEMENIYEFYSEIRGGENVYRK